MANVLSMDLRVRFKTLMEDGLCAAAAGKTRKEGAQISAPRKDRMQALDELWRRSRNSARLRLRRASA